MIIIVIIIIKYISNYDIFEFLLEYRAVMENKGVSYKIWSEDLNTHFIPSIYKVSIKSFPDYKHLLQENYVEYKYMFLNVTQLKKNFRN
jgi:hypothetical protein